MRKSSLEGGPTCSCLRILRSERSTNVTACSPCSTQKLSGVDCFRAAKQVGGSRSISYPRSESWEVGLEAGILQHACVDKEVELGPSGLSYSSACYIVYV